MRRGAPGLSAGFLLFASVFGAGRAAADSDGGAPATSAGSGSVSGCVEIVPTGMQKPVITSSFPNRGTSGYAAVLHVEIEHGKGESVLPRGLELQGASESAKELKRQGFSIPDQDGGAHAQLTPDAKWNGRPDRAKTTLDLPLVALPPEPGRHVLVLPPLAVAVARASGEIATVCTRSHSITVDDPTSSTPEATPKPNPPPLAQREEWTALKKAVTWAALGLAIGAVLAYALVRYLRRPKPVPPPPPPRPPWEVALERLDEIRHAGLLEVDRVSEYFDRVNDTIRSYLGARFGFDGLESTTDEIVARLSGQHLPGLIVPEVVSYLRDCDLVKFANVTPSKEDCLKALATSESIVRSTMPRERAFSNSEVPR